MAGSSGYSKEYRVTLAHQRGIIFDPEDQHIIELASWIIGSHGYPMAGFMASDGKRQNWLLHQKIMGYHPGMVIDHINKNKLDNRRSNLRVVTQSDNMKNGSLSRIFSVVFRSKHGDFLGRIQVGTFKDEDEANKEMEMIEEVLRKAGYKFPHERRFEACVQTD